MAGNSLEIAKIESILGLTFEPDKAYLYRLALSHSSYVNEQQNKFYNNERLEFLGDSVLDLCVTEYLYRNFPYRNEGRLSKLKSYIVSAESLAVVAREFHLGPLILLGKGESQDGGQHKDSVLANVVESLIGACYLDQGLEKSREFVLRLLNGQLQRYQNDTYLPQDAKLRLQEYVQKHYKILPQYQTEELLSNDKKDHSYRFESKLYINKKLIGCGLGNNKKQAEKNAASQAWTQILENDWE